MSKHHECGRYDVVPRRAGGRSDLLALGGSESPTAPFGSESKSPNYRICNASVKTALL
jgi:hypothetical protein